MDTFELFGCASAASASTGTTDFSLKEALEIMRSMRTMSDNQRKNEDEQLRSMRLCPRCWSQPKYNDSRQLELCDTYYQALKKDPRVQTGVSTPGLNAIAALAIICVPCIPINQQFESAIKGHDVVTIDDIIARSKWLFGRGG